MLLMNSCSGWLPVATSLGEKDSGFTYIPLDPLPVIASDGKGCDRDYNLAGYPLLAGIKLRPILDALPDNAVRVAVKEYDASGKPVTELMRRKIKIDWEED